MWKVPIAGGEPTRLNTSPVAYYPAVSPDGMMLAYYHEDSSGQKGVEVMRLNGDNPARRFDIPYGNHPVDAQWSVVAICQERR